MLIYCGNCWFLLLVIAFGVLCNYFILLGSLLFSFGWFIVAFLSCDCFMFDVVVLLVLIWFVVTCFCLLLFYRCVVRMVCVLCNDIVVCFDCVCYLFCWCCLWFPWFTVLLFILIWFCFGLYFDCLVVYVYDVALGFVLYLIILCYCVSVL